MQLQNFYAWDSNGNIMPLAAGMLYLPGTETLATGLQDVNGAPLSNPFTADSKGLFSIAAPNGYYDFFVNNGPRSGRLRVMFIDVDQVAADAESANDAAAVAVARTVRFLAPSSTAPAARADGSPLQVGDRYVNTSTQVEYIYKADGWASNDSLEAVATLQDQVDSIDDEVGQLSANTAAAADYSAIRAYSGAATSIRIKRGKTKGVFYKDDTVSADDGATTLIGTFKWRRDNPEGRIDIGWWDVPSGQDIAAALAQAALLGPVDFPVGEIVCSPVNLPTGTIIQGKGKTRTTVRPFSGTSNIFNINGANAVTIADLTVQGSATAKDGEDLALILASNGFYNITLKSLRVIQGSQCGIILTGGLASNERSQIYDCDIYSNKYQGLRISETAHVDILNNQIHDNGHHGIALQPMVATWTAYAVDDVLMHGNRVYNNVGHGIYVLPLIFGGTLTNPLYSFTNQQYCRNVRASQNEVYANSASGIMAGGFDCTYTGNICRGNGTIGDGYSGIVGAGFSIALTGNSCTGNSTYGIDVGGSYDATVVGNTCSYNAVGKSFGIGLNVGASSGCTIVGNSIAMNGADTSNHYQMMIAGWDGDGVYAYELQGGFNVIANNNIRCFPNNYGIYIRHSVQYAKVSGNYIAQCSRLNAIVNETDFSESVNVIENNTHDISSVAGGVTISSAAALLVDDYNSEYIVTGTTNITSLVTKSNADNAGKIVSSKITSPGSGYTSKPTVTISGGGGSGATATAEISRSGTVMGLNITNKGSGYTSNPTISFSGGGGSGAAATAVFGMKNQAGRRITLQFEGVLTVTIPGMNASYTASGGSTLTLEGRKNGNGQWVELSRAA